MNKSPLISIVIPTYNEENNIVKCLSSIMHQNYPKELLEIIVVDNYSTDATISLASKFAVKILYNKIKDPEVSKMVGFLQSNGELFMYLDADIEIIGNEWLNQLVYPLIRNKDIAGAFPRFTLRKSDPALNRFLHYHNLELDPVLEYFCTNIKNTVIAEETGYQVCKFIPPRIPPIGICLYRKYILTKCIGNMAKFMDIDVPVTLAKNGYNQFAFVKSCAIYHGHISSISEIIKKRRRNINNIYLPNLEKREFQYFNLKRKIDILKILSWVIYANLVIPASLKGIYKTFKYRDLACMYEPGLALILTDVIILEFIRSDTARTKFFRQMVGK